jgi:3-phenylpropionate/trans-cinnamate dioxygenase ferredoxin subunit
MLYWYKIAEHANALPWQENGICVVQVRGKDRLLAKVGEACKAVSATCPHAGATLAEGCLNARGEIVCPLHHYRFRIENGYNSSGEGYRLKTYLVEEREDGVYLGLSESPENG